MGCHGEDDEAGVTLNFLLVGQNCFRKCCELHALMTELDDLFDDFFCRSLATIEYGADLHGSCLDGSHGCIPLNDRRSCVATQGRGLAQLHHGVDGNSARAPRA